ncbi:cytochrome c550 [Cytobacillus purgationiresistens]|uniref:Cytochrome c550 n=1 Tax=Cytobacillus purgationiresistens TaxID=863449 RepID=A0ABU0AGD5_9BACI|nr:cytochrome c [Cytobacillus purgationiresistens]MDQ0269478.1 cytochrome c550 [Cytobacillus purgationiresistens]
MNRNPLIPFALIAILGIGAMFLVSFKGLGDMKELAGEGEEPQTEETASADPEEIYQQSCISCHGDQYQGGVGPALTGVGDKLSEDEIVEILTNGKGAMPGGLVAGKEADMAAWLSELE